MHPLIATASYILVAIAIAIYACMSAHDTAIAPHIDVDYATTYS